MNLQILKNVKNEKIEKKIDKKIGKIEDIQMIVKILSTLNNTSLTFTDYDGQVKAWKSAGSAGFKGPRRATNYAAQQAGELLAKTIRQLGYKSVHVHLKGLGPGREASVKGLKIGGLRILKIQDFTPIPHNGCRPPKKRRL